MIDHNQDDGALDKALRPLTFDDFIGQNQIKENLKIYVAAAKARRSRKEAGILDHVLFSGPPGLGKTTMANIIGNELSAEVKTTSGPALEKTGDLAGILAKIEEGDILFIDEIHRLRIEIEEFLYSAMEDGKIDIVLGSGPTSSRTMTINIHPFTLIGATTREDLLTKAFRDRFGINETLELYDIADTTRIAQRSARLLNNAITEKAAILIARASRGVPRNVNRYIHRIRDVAEVLGDGSITEAIAEKGLRMQGIDESGLGENERKILKLLSEYPKGVGLKTLARTLNIGDKAIEEVYEPFLLAEGLIQITSKGRAITSKGKSVIGVANQQSLKFD